nr:DUF5677 domain-containing protein [uncultured Flavobacterium sp.]
MPISYSLDDLKQYHTEAINFFAAELMILKEVIPCITDERLKKTSSLLFSCGQTGYAILQLASQTDTLTGQSAMLARALMETITNFCYASICDEKEYRAFILHPAYKYYHSITAPKIDDDWERISETYAARKQKQEELKEIPVMKEALELFSEDKPNMNWTKKTLSQRIDVITKHGKLMDFLFVINKNQYYSDASEALHGSLYGCTYQTGVFNPEFDHTEKGVIKKKLYKDNTAMLLHLGMLIHESLTLIHYSNDIKELWEQSYDNRSKALNLLFHVMEVKRKKYDWKTIFK